MQETIEQKVEIEFKDQEMADLNKLNDDYKPIEKHEYPVLNFVDIEEKGVYVK